MSQIKKSEKFCYVSSISKKGRGTDQMLINRFYYLRTFPYIAEPYRPTKQMQLGQYILRYKPYIKMNYILTKIYYTLTVGQYRKIGG